MADIHYSAFQLRSLADESKQTSRSFYFRTVALRNNTRVAVIYELERISNNFGLFMNQIRASEIIRYSCRDDDVIVVGRYVT